MVANGSPSILRTPRVRRNSTNHQCGESFFAGRGQSRMPFPKAAVDHEISFTLLSIWAISPPRRIGHHDHSAGQISMDLNNIIFGHE
jgi:hypothetical protein